MPVNDKSSTFAPITGINSKTTIQEMGFSLSRFLFKLRNNIPDDHKIFEGRYHEGKAIYAYIPSERDEILDGKFKYLHLLGKRKMYRKASGRFARDKKDGSWYFARRGYDSIKKLYAEYQDGELTGSMEYFAEERDAYYVKVTHLYMNVSRGTVQGKFIGRFDNGEFEGYCDEKGLADGVWRLTYNENGKTLFTKKEVWDHGELTDSYEESASKHRTQMQFKLREHINYILQHDVQHLVHIISRGSNNSLVHIYRKHNNIT